MSQESPSPERHPSKLNQQVAPDLADEGDAAVLARLGYKQELRRNFTMIEVFGIAFSIMGLLPSIASTLSYSIPAGPVGMVWGWFIPSGFIFIVGLAMISRDPVTIMLSLLTVCLVRRSWFCDANQWRALLVDTLLRIPKVEESIELPYGFSLMFLSVIVIAKDGNYTPSNGAIYGVFLVCVICHGILASTMSKIMGKLQTVFVVMNFVLIFATIIALPIGKKMRNDGHYIFAQTENLTTWPTGWAFMLAWLSPIWTIGGFDSCVHMSEEASNATKAVPYGILMSIGSCWFFGFILLIVIAACINPDLSAVYPGQFGQPMAQIYFDALGKHGALGLMSLLFIVQFLMGLSILVAASRQAWAFSRDGALPFSRFFRPISEKFGFIPLRAIWGCVTLAAFLGLLSLIASAAAQALFSLAVAGNNVAWGTPILCRVVYGQKKFKPGPVYTGDFWSPIIAYTAVVFLVFGVVLSMIPVGGPNPTPDTMNYTVVINCAVWGGALGYYFIDARKWFTGPKITLNLDDLSESQERALAEEGLDIQPVKSQSIGGGEVTDFPDKTV
ncbi:MAG: GABA-specific high-affinity permease [Pycnora praestabilis]|nr:MAG: GABA-specific high-affinity permease [Pycnora praestabilis]